MEEKLNGIVLGGVSYGENDKILNIFTLEKGTVSAKIKGVKKGGAKLKFAAERFCFAEFVFSVKSDKRTVTGASLIDSFYPVREDLVKFYCAGTVIEFIKRFEIENIVSADMFALTVSALKKIAYGNDSPRVALIEFLLSALKTVGYGLNLEGCHVCGNHIDGRIFFDCFSGGFSCENHKDGFSREINYATYLALRNVEDGETVGEFNAVRCLRLLDFYLINKPEEKLNSLKELLQLATEEE
ncbi:MAG: DNA repair protein RecO [Clostridia bacterium]|nr:DNA repair protein RecO [Clostridia bacterium]